MSTRERRVWAFVVSPRPLAPRVPAWAAVLIGIGAALLIAAMVGGMLAVAESGGRGPVTVSRVLRLLGDLVFCCGVPVIAAASIVTVGIAASGEGDPAAVGRAKAMLVAPVWLAGHVGAWCAASWGAVTLYVRTPVSDWTPDVVLGLLGMWPFAVLVLYLEGLARGIGEINAAADAEVLAPLTCGVCGYSLEGLPGMVCPECGAGSGG